MSTERRASNASTRTHDCDRAHARALRRAAAASLLGVLTLAACSARAPGGAQGAPIAYTSGGSYHSVASAPAGGYTRGYAAGAADVATVAVERSAPAAAPVPRGGEVAAVRRAPTAAGAGAPAGGALGGMVAVPAAPAPTVAVAPAMPRTPPPPPVAPAVVEAPPVREDLPEPVQEQAGSVLTAASVGDTDRRDNYLEYLARHMGERESVGLDMTRRLRVRVVDRNGRGVNDAALSVSLEGSQSAVRGRTHADGVWDFYPGAYGANLAGRGQLAVTLGGVRRMASIDVPATGDGQDVVVQLDNAQAAAPTALDLAFLIDVTGSMGDELRYVNREVAAIVQRIRAATPNLRVRVGATFYRDRTDDVLVQDLAFTENVGSFSAQMQRVFASGGGDYPEDMNTGFDHALHNLQWSEGNVARVLVVIADAPPQQYPNAQFSHRDALREASTRGIRVLPVAASGANRTVEYLFRAMGAATSTPYTYLTDDSGVGGPHMEADTDRVAVERFNDLLTRLVVSDLRGEGMHEPGPLAPRS